MGSLFINSRAKEGPDSATKGWRGFFNDWGIIWDIILSVFSSRPLLRDMKGKPGSTKSATPSRNDELNCNGRDKIQNSESLNTLMNAKCVIQPMFCIWLKGLRRNKTSVLLILNYYLKKTQMTWTGTAWRQKSASSNASFASVVATTFSGSFWFGKYLLQKDSHLRVMH